MRDEVACLAPDRLASPSQPNPKRFNLTEPRRAQRPRGSPSLLAWGARIGLSFGAPISKVAAAARKLFAVDCLERLGWRMRSRRFALGPSLILPEAPDSPEPTFSLGLLQILRPKNFAQNNISCRPASHLARSRGFGGSVNYPH